MIVTGHERDSSLPAIGTLKTLVSPFFGVPSGLPLKDAIFSVLSFSVASILHVNAEAVAIASLPAIAPELVAGVTVRAVHSALVQVYFLPVSTTAAVRGTERER